MTLRLKVNPNDERVPICGGDTFRVLNFASPRPRKDTTEYPNGVFLPNEILRSAHWFHDGSGVCRD